MGSMLFLLVGRVFSHLDKNPGVRHVPLLRFLWGSEDIVSFVRQKVSILKLWA